MSNVIPFVSSSPPPMDDGHFEWADDDDKFESLASLDSNISSRDLDAVSGEHYADEWPQSRNRYIDSSHSDQPTDSGKELPSRKTISGGKESTTKFGLVMDSGVQDIISTGEDDFDDFVVFQADSENKGQSQAKQSMTTDHEGQAVDSIMEKSRESLATDSGVYSTDISPLPKSGSFSVFEGEKVSQSEDDFPPDDHLELQSNCQSSLHIQRQVCSSQPVASTSESPSDIPCGESDETSDIPCEESDDILYGESGDIPCGESDDASDIPCGESDETSDIPFGENGDTSDTPCGESGDTSDIPCGESNETSVTVSENNSARTTGHSSLKPFKQRNPQEPGFLSSNCRQSDNRLVTDRDSMKIGVHVYHQSERTATGLANNRAQSAPNILEMIQCEDISEEKTSVIAIQKSDSEKGEDWASFETLPSTAFAAGPDHLVKMGSVETGPQEIEVEQDNVKTDHGNFEVEQDNVKTDHGNFEVDQGSVETGYGETESEINQESVFSILHCDVRMFNAAARQSPQWDQISATQLGGDQASSNSDLGVAEVSGFYWQQIQANPNTVSQETGRDDCGSAFNEENIQVDITEMDQEVIECSDVSLKQTAQTGKQLQEEEEEAKSSFSNDFPSDEISFDINPSYAFSISKKHINTTEGDLADFSSSQLKICQNEKVEDEFGDFSSGPLICQIERVEVELNDLSSLQAVEHDKDINDFSAFSARQATPNKLEDDFGEFSCSGLNKANDNTGDRLGAEQSESVLSANVNTEDFVPVSLTVTEEESEEFGDFSGQSGVSTVAQDSGWADFSPDREKERLCQLSASSTDHDAQCRQIERVLKACFPQSANPSGDYQHLITSVGISPLGGLLKRILPHSHGLHYLQASQQTEHLSKKDPRVKLWNQLQEMDRCPAMVYQWTKSTTNSYLFKTLQIDTQNMLIGHKKPSVPIFATGLSLLEPIRGAAREQQSKDILSGTTAMHNATLVDPSWQQVHQATQEIPAVDFDWTTSGLTNPLTSRSLDLDFLVVQDNQDYEKSAVLESELLDGPRSSVKCSQPLEEILKNIKPTSVRSKLDETARCQISSEAAGILAGLPDLSFMHSKVLMFPIKN